MRFNGTTIPTHRDETYDSTEVSRYVSSGGGDIDVEALNVTENGTYIAPDGKAYTPVNVNVNGGGSSDFSTAEVTIINNNARDTYVKGAMWFTSGDLAYSSPSDMIELQSETVFSIILYKGGAVISTENEINWSFANATGDIEIDSENSSYAVVRGNGTIGLVYHNN